MNPQSPKINFGNLTGGNNFTPGGSILPNIGNANKVLGGGQYSIATPTPTGNQGTSPLTGMTSQPQQNTSPFLYRTSAVPASMQNQPSVQQAPQSSDTPLSQQGQNASVQGTVGSPLPLNAQSNNSSPQSNAPVGFGASSVQSQPQGGNFLSNAVSQFASLTSDQKAQLGLGPTSTQKDIITRLSNLSDTLSQLNVPDPTIRSITDMINDKTNTLNNLTPQGYLSANPTIAGGDVSKSYMDSYLQTQRGPLEQGLANLVLSKSVLTQQRDNQINQANAQMGNLGNQYTYAGQLAGNLPASVGQDIAKTALVPQITPHFETIGNRRVQINTNQMGQVVSQTDMGPAPTNAFNYFQNDPNGAQGILGAVQGGLLNPGDVNSRNMGFYSALYKQNPQFNSNQAQAAANFWQSTGTQDKLAWANSVTSNLDLIQNLSNQVSRSDFPLVNKALLTGEIQSGNSAAVQLANAANRTAAELSKVLGDSGGSDFRTKLAGQLLDPNYSPDQLAAAIKTEKEMIGSLQNAFKTAGGQDAASTNSPSNPSSNPSDINALRAKYGY